VHSSRKETVTHVKSWLKFAKSIELVRCMTAMKAVDVREANGKKSERTRVPVGRKDLYSLVDDDTRCVEDSYESKHG
jgi:hypothetical protein